MVAVVSGNSLGLNLTSLGVLGAQGGVQGNPTEGRSDPQSVFVNADTGNLVVQQRQNLLVGAGEDIDSILTYNSLGLFNDDNGDGWSLGKVPVQLQLSGTVNTAGSTLTRTAFDGSQQVFKWDATLTPPAYICRNGTGAFDTLTWSSTTSKYTYVDGATQETETYDAAGTLLTRTDPSGNALTFVTSGGLLRSISDQNGETVTYTYGGTNGTQLLSVSSVVANGVGAVVTSSVVSYTYDTSNRLYQVIVDLSPADNATTDGNTFTTTLTYVGTTKKLSTLKQSDGTNLTFTYDASNRLYTVKDGIGNLTTFTYDTANRKTSVMVNNATTVYAYNANDGTPGEGQLASVTSPSGNATTYSYNANGEVSKIVDGENHATYMTYDAAGNCLSTRDANGGLVTRTYDSKNNLVTETSSALFVPALTTQVTGTGAVTVSGGDVTKTGPTSGGFDSSVYSSTGYTGSAAVSFKAANTTSAMVVGLNTDPATDPTGGSIDWGLNCTSSGTLQAKENGTVVDLAATYTTDDLLGVTYDGANVTYWKNGEVLRTVAATISAQIFVDSSFSTNGAGVRNLRFGAAWYGDSSAAGQVAALKASSGMKVNGADAVKTGGVANTWDSSVRSVAGLTNGATVSFTAGTPGKALMVGLNTDPDTDLAGNSLDYALHLTTSGTLEAWSNGGSLKALGSFAKGDRLAVSYDGAGHVKFLRNGVALYTVNVTITQPLYADTSFYSAGATAAALSFGSGGGVTSTTRYVYSADGKGLLRFKITPDGRVTEYGYNPKGVLTSTNVYAAAYYNTAGLTPASVPTEADMTTWRGQQDLTQTVRTDYKRDTRQQINQVVQYVTTAADGTGVATGSSTTNYVYDPSGRLLQVTKPGSAITTYVYDGLGRIKLVTDPLNAANPTRQTSTSYDDANGTVTVTTGNNLVVTTTYDNAGHVTSVATTDNGAAAATTWAYYDKQGHLLRTTDATGIYTWYLYDADDRRIAEIDGNGTMTEYVYNKANLVTETLTYATPVNTALLVGSDGKPSNPDISTVRPTFNTLTDTRSWNVYNAANKLRQTIDALGAVTTYFYDARGLLVETAQWANKVAVGGLGGSPGPVSPTPDPVNDRWTRYFHDEDGRLVGKLDALYYLTEYQYDAAGRLAVTMAYAGQSPTAAQGYGTLAQLRPAPSNDDQRTVQLYDLEGRVSGVIDAEGYLTETAYDLRGTVNHTTRYAKSVGTTVSAGVTVDSIRPVTDSEDRTTKYSYDLADRLKVETNYENSQTTYTLDVNTDEVLAVAAASNMSDKRTITRKYDGLGRVIAELSGVGSDALALATTQAQIDAAWAQYQTTYAYDKAGRLCSKTDAQAHTTWFFYDKDGQLTYTVNHKGEVEKRSYDGLERLSAIEKVGTTITTGGMTGGVASDAFIAKVATAEQANPALNSTTQYTYDAVGHVKTVTDAVGFVKTNNYDAFGDVTSQVRDVRIDAGNVHVTATDNFIFDTRGQQTSNLLDKNGVGVTNSVVLDAFGRATQVTGPNGKSVTHVYDRLGREVQVTDQLSKSHWTTYDAFGQVLTTQDAYQKTTTYTYDRANRTVTVTTPEGVSVTTTHDHFGQVTYVHDDGNNIAESWSFDDDGNLTEHWKAGVHVDHRDYDSADRLIDTQDANGIFTSFTYDAANRVLTRTVDPDQLDVNGNVTYTGLKLKTQYAYDAKGQQWQVIDANGYITKLTFDLDGRVTQQEVGTSGPDLTTTYTYDAAGNALTVAVDPNGLNHVTTYKFDALGRRTQEKLDTNGMAIVTNYAYDTSGNLVTKTQAGGTVTRYTYDDANRLVYTVDPTGGTTFNEYDDNGRIVRTTQYAKAISLSGLASAPTSADVKSRVSASQGKDLVQATRYDRDGRVRFQVDGFGAVVETRYDTGGRVTDKIRYAKPIALSSWAINTDPPVVASVPADASQDISVHYNLDGLGRVLSDVTDSGGLSITRKYTYDSVGNVLTRTDGSTLNGVARTCRFTYDAGNRMTRSVDGEGGVQAFQYDAMGRVVRTTQYTKALSDTDFAAIPSPLTAAWVDAHIKTVSGQKLAMTTSVYDQAGRKSWSVDAMGAATKFIYDKAGNVTSVMQYAIPVDLSTWTDISVAPTVTGDANNDRLTRTQYDALNRVTYQANGANEVVGYTYDVFGMVLSKTSWFNRITASQQPSDAPSNPSPSDRVELYAYDLAHRETFRANGEGEQVASVYNGAGQLTQVTAYAKRIANYSAASDVTVVHVDTNNDRTTDYAYDGAGRQAWLTDASNHVVGTVFDALGQELSTTAYNNLYTGTDPSKVTPNPTWDRTDSYVYDTAGRRTSHTDAMGNLEKWSYDLAGRKSAFTDKKGNYFQYGYDGAGRLITQKSPWVAVTTATADASGVITAGEASVQIVTTFNYDGMGHLSSRIDADGRAEARTTSYSYDLDGRQTVTTYPTVGVYSQDPASASISQLGTAGRIEISKTPSTTTMYDAFGDAVASKDVGGNVAYKTYDKAGRVKYAVDAYGLITSYGYDAFGEQTGDTVYGALSTTLTLTYPTDPQGFIKTSDVSAAITNEGLGGRTDNRWISTVYDRAGRATSVTQAGVFTFDASTGTTKTASPQTLTTYDAFGDKVLVRRLKNNDDTNNPVYADTYDYYDVMGRDIRTIDPMGYVTTRQYNVHGELTDTIDYVTAFDAGTWSLTNDGGTPTAKTAAAGGDRNVHYDHDLLGNKTAETHYYTRYNTDDSGGTASNGALVTHYSYDALGNLTCTTDAAGNSTFNYYDGLGRVVAVYSPQRTVNGTVVYPLTEFHHDAFGSVVQQIARYVGYSGTPIDSTGYGQVSSYGNRIYYNTPNGNDRFTTNVYNALGQVIETQDQMGFQTFSSYNTIGKVAKTWQTVTQTFADGTTAQHARFTSYRYDKLGRLVNQYSENSALTGVINEQTAYNVFSEVTDHWVGSSANGSEHYDYDNAGRVWRARGADGVPTISYYDLLGNNTAAIQSQGGGGVSYDANLGKNVWTSTGSDLMSDTITGPGTVQGWSGLRRTDMVYDLDGHVVQTVLPTRANQGTGSVAYAMGVQAYPQNGNQLVVTWSSLAGLGSGGMRLTVWYKDGGGHLQSATPVFFDYPGPPVVNGRQSYTFNLGSVSAGVTVRVEKKDVTGNWIKVIDRSDTNGLSTTTTWAPFGTMVWADPPVDEGVNERIQWRTHPNGSWSAPGPMVQFGKQALWDASWMSAGTYDYQVTLEGNPTPIASGTFTTKADNIEQNGTDSARPVVTQTVDRWGNVLTKTDARNAAWVTQYTYDTFGHMVEEIRPQDVYSTAPTVWYYYDQVGRQVAVRDENNHVTGTVYDAAGEVIREDHADTGYIQRFYTVYGELQKEVDPDGNATSYLYDWDGRKTKATRAPVAFYAWDNGVLSQSPTGKSGDGGTSTIQWFNYDEVGDEITESNGFDSQVTTYVYDLGGHVIEKDLPKVAAPAPAPTPDPPPPPNHGPLPSKPKPGAIVYYTMATTMTYDDMGRKTSETDANTGKQTWAYDYYGGVTGHTDLNKSAYQYTYDNDHQLVWQTSGHGQDLRKTYDTAGQLIKVDDFQNSSTAVHGSMYGYDLAGHRTWEKTWYPGVDIQNTYMSYDTLGRMVLAEDARMSISISYDKVGNKTKYQTHTYLVEVDDHWAQDAKDQTLYYLYDSMNRQVVVDGVDASGNINSLQGHVVSYDMAGNRMSDQTYGNRVTWDGSHWQASAGWVEDDYTYDNQNRLLGVYHATIDSFTHGSFTATESSKTQVDHRYYDQAGRILRTGPDGLMTSYAEAINSGVAQNQSIGSQNIHYLYDEAGRTTQQATFNSVNQLESWVLNRNDATGNVMSYTEYVYTDGAYQYQRLHAFGQAFFDTYEKTTEKITLGNVTNTSRIDYDANGYMTNYTDLSTPDHTNDKKYRSNVDGVIVDTLQGDPTNYSTQQMQRQFIANGDVMARYGIAPTETQHVQWQPPPPPGPNYAQVVDYNFGFDKIDGAYPNSSLGSYVVQAGDTLRSIAMNAYGDSALWYRIAEANGMSGDSDLRIGQSIDIPNNAAAGIHNNVSTIQPYDPSQIVGDTSPTAPVPPVDKGCGKAGQIIMTVVAVVVAAIVTYYLGPVAGEGVYGVLITAAAAGAAASVASQLVGDMIGAHKGFSWKEVAMSTISSVVTAGMGGGAAAGGNWVQVAATAAARAAVANAVTQGIEVELHLKKDFSWKEVVGSAAGAAVASGVTSAMDDAKVGTTGWVGFGRDVATHFASGVATQVARGGKIGWASVAADAFGNALGDSVGDWVVNALDASDYARQSTLDARAETARLLARYPAPAKPEQATDVAGALLPPTGTLPANSPERKAQIESQLDDVLLRLLKVNRASAFTADAGDYVSGGIYTDAGQQRGGPDLSAAAIVMMSVKDKAALVLKLLDGKINDIGNQLPPAEAAQAGVAYGAFKSFAGGIADVGELALHSAIYVGNKFLHVVSDDAAAESAQYFDNLKEGLQTLGSDFSGTLKKVYGGKYDDYNRLMKQGKIFEASAIVGGVAVDALSIALGGAGLAKAIFRFGAEGVAALKTLGTALSETQGIVGKFSTAFKELGFSGVMKGMKQGDLGKLASIVMKSSGNLEVEGVAYAYGRMSELGYVLEGDLIYGQSGHGLDMVFRNTGRVMGKEGELGTIAVLEAKRSDTLGALETANGARQGSARYIEYQLSEYLRQGGQNVRLATEMQAQLANGTLESFASLQRADRLAEFDLTRYITGVKPSGGMESLNAKRFFIEKNVPRPGSGG